MTSDPANRGNALGVQSEDEAVIVAPPLIGTNNRSSARYIADGQAAELLNVDLSDPTVPKKRDGYERTQSAFLPLLKRGSLLAELEIAPESRLMVVGFQGGPCFTTTSPNGPPWTEARIIKSLTALNSQEMDVSTDQAKAVQGNELLWLVTPSTGKNIYAMDFTGQWRDLGAVNESPPSNAADAAYMLSRMWFLAGDRLYWSKLLPTLDDMVPSPNAFDRDNVAANGGGSINLSPDRGALPVALVPWRDQSLLAFFRNQIEEIVIDPIDPIDSARRRIEGRIGCGARDSIVQVGDEIYFLDQFGNYRALRQNELGSLQGVVPKPISEAFRGELPGNLNKPYAYRTTAALLEEFVYLCYPSGSSPDCDSVMVLDLGAQRLYGPWRFPRGIARLMVSDIEGGEFRLYGLDGGSAVPLSALYRFFDGKFTDDGTAISYRETSKAWDLGMAWAKKLPRWYDLEFLGGYTGCRPRLSMRTSETQDFVDIRDKAMEFDGESDFPLLASDFPILAADFPLVQANPAVTVMRGMIDEAHSSDLPLYSQDLPITEADLPIDEGGGMTPGRFVQWRITESTAGAEFERVGFRVGVNIGNLALEDEV